MKLISPEGLLVNHIVATHDYDFKLNEENHQEYKKRMIYMIEYYKSSENYKRIKSTLQENFEFDSKMNTVSWFKQFYQILNRGFKNELRNPLDLKMRLTSTLFFSVLQIIVFKGVCYY